ncbi:E3 ubiquitin-protein ligase RNF31 [Lamellibrachia satsuma]|nr:E3 ubiquitin-protein ligase RNF31 [Lamellibrachia satsuma]
MLFFGNKSSVATTIPEQSEAAAPSTSFVTVAEINDVDVPGPNELSYQEVKEILYTCKGQFDLTIGQCHDARKAKLDLLQAAGVFNEAEALAALHQCKGNLEEAQKCIVDNIIEHSDWSKANFQQTLRDKAVDRRKKIRLLLTCGHLQCVEQADTFLQILDMDDLEGNITLADILESVKSCSNLSRSISYLQQECQLCLHHFSASQIHSLFLCQCKICIDCLTQYLELYVREKLIKEFVCPVCDEPDTENIDLAETHFEFLDMMIRTLMSPELYSLFEHKLTEWHLMRDPNFRWCSQPGCVSGFIGDPHELRMECPTCKQATCFQCKKPWADQHDGITCEEFQVWKEANDPEHQQAGLARHLEDNGIDCPHCNFRYSLAKGGCMHFKCIQCGHEFCSGCLRPFKRGSNCNVLQSCQRAGLHCHHPRDCLFYLRDRDVSDLQTLLNDNSVEYNTAAPSGSDCSPTCQVMEQKEMPNGLQDEPCQRPVPLYYAGLCETHYKEYLVSLINKNAIDPVVIMSTQELKRLLTNAGKSAPQKARRESGERYHKKLIEQVKQLLPLPTRRGGSSS